MIIFSKISFLEHKAFYTLVGAIITIFTFTIGQIINMKREKSRHKRTVLIALTQNNKELFSIIIRGTIDSTTIEYDKLRKHLLEASWTFFIMPKDIKNDFNTLMKIFLCDPREFLNKKKDVPRLLNNITKKLKKYGVEVIG